MGKDRLRYLEWSDEDVIREMEKRLKEIKRTLVEIKETLTTLGG